MTNTLSARTLDAISRTASVPNYDRTSLKAGIFHFGVGNFHRAHQAVYLDELMNLGEGHDFAIVGSGVREADAVMRRALHGQDWLTTVVAREGDQSSARVTGSMIDFVHPGDAPAILARLSDPAIRIVSLTVTEGGYYIDPASQRFNPDHPDIVADAAADTPKTVFGLILAALAARRATGQAPFTVMSCDNLPHNGHIAREAVLGLARLRNTDLANWIEQDVAFPNSMVDRITPATGERERSLLADSFGITDAWPVFCESFKQWVLEDDFPRGRPPLEQVGVEFVSDVAPYELMKIRILNGGHAAIAYPAALLGIHFVHEAMEHPLISAFLRKVATEEIIPIVPPVPGIDLGDYFALCEKRFANPAIGDTIRRLAFDGSNRQPKFILSSVGDTVKANGSLSGLALVSALWCRYCYGTDEAGTAIAPNDPGWDRLTAEAGRARENPVAWLDMKDIYGDIGRHLGFREAFCTALGALWTDGTSATLSRYITGP